MFQGEKGKKEENGEIGLKGIDISTKQVNENDWFSNHCLTFEGLMQD